jgi:phospho-N-acetylmuramoyl-pentapeptide-transferase
MVFCFALVFGVIGFIDDYMKVKYHKNEGLTAAQKFLLQLAAAIVFTVLLRSTGYLAAELYIPFVNVTVAVPWVVYMVFAAFVIVGTVNSVNITDGVDGLATGVTMPVMVFYTAAALLWKYTELGVLSAAMLGGLAGFLVYNFHPAKVFMGDTGSLFLGGMVCGLAFALDMPLILILVGIVYIAETASDIIQVSYFKMTHGKRVFRMAPLHHHFEMGGWSEYKLFTVFTAVTAVACLLAWLGVMGR